MMMCLACEACAAAAPREVDASSFSMDKKAHPPQEPIWTRKNTLQKEASADPQQSSEGIVPLQKTGSFCTEVDFLYWQSSVWGLNFAAIASGGGALSFSETAYTPSFDWKAGLKAAMSYYLDFDGWQIDGRWTFAQGETFSTRNAPLSPPDSGVVPFWFYPFYDVSLPSRVRFTNAALRWNLYFNSIDLEIGRSGSLSQRIDLRLCSGLKGAWIRQYLRTSYADGSTIFAIIPGLAGLTQLSLQESYIAFKNETWGAGPLFGFHSLWNLFWGFCGIADAQFSLLLSTASVSRSQSDRNQDSGGVPIPFSLSLNTRSLQLKPAFEGQLGLQWKHSFNRKNALEIAFAYEVQYWWAQNELRRSTSHAAPGSLLPVQGDLQMQGLTCRAGYVY